MSNSKIKSDNVNKRGYQIELKKQNLAVCYVLEKYLKHKGTLRTKDIVKYIPS